MNSKIKTIALILLISFINVGHWSNYDAPSVVAPLLRDEWGLSSSQLGQAYSFYSFPNLVIPLLYGALTDRVGPVWGLPVFFCLSQFFVTLGSVGVWLSNGNIPLFLGSRTVMGLGGEYILLGQLAASSKWFPLNQQGIANALIMVVGMVALACLFNIFPLIANQASLFLAFGISSGAAVCCLVLVLIYSILHVRFSKRLIEADDKAAVTEAGVEAGGKGVVVDMTPLGNTEDQCDEAGSASPDIATAANKQPERGASDDFNGEERRSVDVIGRPAQSCTPGMLNSEARAADDAVEESGSVDNGEVEVEVEVVDVEKEDASSLPQTSSGTFGMTSPEDDAKSKGCSPMRTLVSVWCKLRSFPALFWVLPIVCGFNYGIIQSSIAFSTDMMTTKWSVSEEAGARVSSVIVMAPIVVSIPFGLIIDKVGQRLTGFVVCGALLVISFVALALVPGTTHWIVPAVLLALQGVVFSYVPTAEGSSYTMCCPEGLLSTGMGISYQVNMLTTTIVPLILGRMHDKTDSYTSGLFLLAGLSLFTFSIAIVGIFLDRARVKKEGKLSLQSSQVGPVAHHH